MTSERAHVDPSQLPIGQQLCTACGICCNAALHNLAVLAPEERELASDLGLDVIDQDGPKFALPCPHLSGTACSVFESRPRVCSRYRCQLLIDVEDGQRSLDDALEKVETARDLLLKIDRLAVVDLNYAEARAVAAPSLNPAGAERAKAKIGNDSNLYNRVRLQATALLVYLDKHFREGNSSSLVMSPVRLSEFPE